jgi:hypothetical protein
MAWLSSLDNAAKRTHPIWHGLYLVVKWSLAAMGGLAVARLMLDRVGIWPLY